MKKKVAIVGTHGVPAKYGGFETLADYLCRELGTKYEITVYCNSKLYSKKNKTYHGAHLIYLPIYASGPQGILYDMITYIHALFTADTILYLSPVGSGFITSIKRLFNKKVIVNHGGLNEWDREKLSPFEQRWAKFCHRLAAKYSDINITDNNLYRQSLKETFNEESIVIRYGGDHVQNIAKNDIRYSGKYPFVNEKYAVSVSRAQIDNNLHMVLEAFETFNDYKLVLVSNWGVSNYGEELYLKYLNHPNIILLKAIYNTEELDFIRGNSYVYVHTHSRCGTSPSLVEAMCLGQAIVSLDVPTNRETTHNKAVFFNDTDSLIQSLRNLTDTQINKNKDLMREIANNSYSWELIANQYDEIF